MNRWDVPGSGIIPLETESSGMIEAGVSEGAPREVVMRALGVLVKSGLLLLVALGLSACGSKPVIGVLLAESGDAAAYGSSMRHGIELALKEAKADTTSPVPKGLSVVWADSGTNPEKAASEYANLVSKGNAVFVIAGVTSGEAKELIPVIKSTQVPCLSPSASLPSLTKGNRLFFRIFPSDNLEGRRAARFLREDKDLDSVLIYSQGSEQARGIEPPFRHVFEQNLEGKVVGRILLSNSNWERESADILAGHSPEAVYVIAYHEDAIRVLKHLRKLHFKGLICMTSAFNNGTAIEANPKLVDGVFFPQPAFDTDDPRPLVQNFLKNFEETYGHKPDIYAAHAFDAMRVALETLKTTKSMTTLDIRKTLQFGLEEFPGVTGPIQFNDDGDVHRNPIMFIIKKGRVRPYEKYLKEEKERIRKKIIGLLQR